MGSQLVVHLVGSQQGEDSREDLQEVGILQVEGSQAEEEEHLEGSPVYVRDVCIKVIQAGVKQEKKIYSYYDIRISSLPSFLYNSGKF